MSRKKILFVRNVNASWAIRDLEILKESFSLIDMNLKVKDYLSPFWLFNVLKSDTLFFWFASLNFLPLLILGKIFGKRIVTVSGGFDAAAAYSINYGAFTHSKLSQRLRKFFFRSSDKILCVSKANMAETIINSGCEGRKCELIYHGFEKVIEDSELGSWSNRENQVVMIAQCTKDTYYRKSVDDFIKLAHLMPDFKFILVGKVDPDLASFFDQTTPANFSYTGFLKFNGEEFKSLLLSSKFIIQMSFYESFGCAVIDGALYGCYPIASSNYSLFEVVEGIGQIYDHGNLMQLHQIISDLSNQNIDSGQIIERCLNRFPIESRIKRLNKSLNEV